MNDNDPDPERNDELVVQTAVEIVHAVEDCIAKVREPHKLSVLGAVTSALLALMLDQTDPDDRTKLGRTMSEMLAHALLSFPETAGLVVLGDGQLEVQALPDEQLH